MTDALFLLVMIVAFGAVARWYARNDHGGRDGDLGVLALTPDAAGEPAPARELQDAARAYRPRQRTAVHNKSTVGASYAMAQSSRRYRPISKPDIEAPHRRFVARQRVRPNPSSDPTEFRPNAGGLNREPLNGGPPLIAEKPPQGPQKMENNLSHSAPHGQAVESRGKKGQRQPIPSALEKKGV